MNEIEFLPAWYKTGRRRQFGYRTQYVALVGIFIVMVVWSFTTGRSVSKAQAALENTAAAAANAEEVSRQTAMLAARLTATVKKAKDVKRIDSHINVPSVLAETSYLIDKNVVLRSVELLAEKFPDQQSASPATGGAIRIARPIADRGQDAPIGDVRFKVVIGGLASTSAHVAGLVRELERSPYFSQVTLAFSKNVVLGVASAQQDDSPTGKALVVVPEDAVAVAEFEIDCYLANYRLE